MIGRLAWAVLAGGWLALHPAMAAQNKAPQHPATAEIPVRIGSYQNARSGRLSISLQTAAAPEIRTVDGGIELHFAKDVHPILPNGQGLREVAGIELRDAPVGPVVLVRFACACGVTTTRSGSLLRVEIKENPKQPVVAAKQPVVPAKKPSPPKEASDLDKLREALTAKLAMLNGGAPASTTAAAPHVASPEPDRTEVAAAPPPPLCPPHFETTTWVRPGNFTARLRELRSRLAQSHESSAAMAALAEFYLFNGLPGEAYTVASEALGGDVRPEDKERLNALGGIARMVKREPLEPASPLLAFSRDCKAPNAALWRALAAAAAGDADGIARDAETAGNELRLVPEPLQQLIAFRIADAAGDNPVSLRAMAGALRNMTVGLPEDEAGRFLLQARIARLGGDAEDERAFLDRAAKYPLTAPGVIAKARLAALRVRHDAPAGDTSEAVLADIARTYRSDAVGQEAAEQYAERRLQLGDYASALAVADETAGPAASRTRDSRGAALVARILRILMVDAAGQAALPAPAERLALYWRYEGYATPGAKGDDIRLGAAHAMLDQQVPEPALELLRQLSDGTAATDEARLLRARAEARAGDPNFTLAVLHTVPAGDEQRRLGSVALARLGQLRDAAHRLDGTTDLADLIRRAGLLFDARAWDEAATAYGELLSDAAMKGKPREDVAERYALAVVLSGGAPIGSMPKLAGAAAHLLATLPPPTDPSETIGPADAVQGALDRARRIETLLPPAPTEKQGS